MYVIQFYLCVIKLENYEKNNFIAFDSDTCTVVFAR